MNKYIARQDFFGFWEVVDVETGRVVLVLRLEVNAQKICDLMNEIAEIEKKNKNKKEGILWKKRRWGSPQKSRQAGSK